MYAHWNEATYRVTYNANGGTINPTYKDMLYFDETYGDLATPTRAGFVFVGWYTESGDGTLVNSSTSAINKTSHTIYAHWNAAQYRVTYDANGGTVSPTYKDMSYFDETYGELATPTKTGYTFAGWYTAVSGGTAVISTTSITNNTGHTIYAHWNVATYTLTYNCNGGSGSTSSSSHTYGVSSSLSSNGCYKVTTGATGMVYYVSAWRTSGSQTTINVGTSITTQFSSNTTLYAVWSNLFTLTGNYEVINDANGNWRVKIKGASGATYGDASIKFNKATTIDIFAVGGGGGGGTWVGGVSAGGGGGGAYSQTKLNKAVTATTYPIYIGAGGAGGISSSTSETTAIAAKNLGSSGEASTAFTITSNGGVGGGCGSTSTWYYGGTGGSAGGNSGANGTDGVYEFNESSSGVRYAAGGGGGDAYYGGNYIGRGLGGAGGGGDGGLNYGQGSPGTTNTGSGGGGAHPSNAGSGGSGIVVIRNHR